MVSVFKYAVIGLAALLVGLASFVFWPASHTPVAAVSECLSLTPAAGKLAPLALDRDQVYGVALTYPGIILEGGYDYDPRIAPPVFRKLGPALDMGGGVKYPSQQQAMETIESLEAGLERRLDEAFATLPILLDYEAELGIVLLEDISLAQLRDPAFAPKLGYFLANDLQSMTLGILGFGSEGSQLFLDRKGSFPGFLPHSDIMWMPSSEGANSLLCIDLQTRVNGELRQDQNSRNRIYTNKQILGFIAAAYEMEIIEAGTAIITGSPAGVASSTPRWKKRLGRLLQMDRIDKIAAVASADRQKGRFLRPGDIVIVEAQPFGSIETRIVR